MILPGEEDDLTKMTDEKTHERKKPFLKCDPLVLDFGTIYNG